MKYLITIALISFLSTICEAKPPVLWESYTIGQSVNKDGSESTIFEERLYEVNVYDDVICIQYKGWDFYRLVLDCPPKKYGCCTINGIKGYYEFGQDSLTITFGNKELTFYFI